MEDYKSRTRLRSWPLPAESLSDFSTVDITLAETRRTSNGLPRFMLRRHHAYVIFHNSV